MAGLDVVSINERAIRTYRKAEFSEESRMRKTVFRDGQRADRVMMNILQAEWTPDQTSSGGAV